MLFPPDQQDIARQLSTVLNHTRHAVGCGKHAEQEWGTAASLCRQITLTYGRPGLVVMILQLADSWVHRQYGAARPGREVHLSFAEVDGRTGLTQRDGINPTEVPPATRWVGELIACRAAANGTATESLLHQITTMHDPSEVIETMLEVVTLCLDASCN